MAASCAVLLAVLQSAPRASQTAPGAVAWTPTTSAASVTGTEGTRGRRLGDRRDRRICPRKFVADRRHRRSRPLPGARSAEGELQRVGARLRARRFAEGRTRAPGKRAEPDGGAGAQRARRGAVLSGRLLVLAASTCPARASSRARDQPATASRRTCAARREWLRIVKYGRLPGVPSARQQGHARDSGGARHVRIVGGRVGAPHAVGPGRRRR